MWKSLSLDIGGCKA